MRRIGLVSTLVAIGTFVGPDLAAADDSPMCTVGTALTTVPAWVLEATEENLVVAMPEAVAVHVAAAVRAPSRPVGTDEVLWCASGLDPRCQPVHSDGDGLFSALAHALLAPAVVGRTAVPRSPVSRLARFATDGGPRDGTHARLERPPRG